MTEEMLIDELNELAECILCPMDLMDSIDEYSKQKVIEELELILNVLDGKLNRDILIRRIKILKQE